MEVSSAGLTPALAQVAAPGTEQELHELRAVAAYDVCHLPGQCTCPVTALRSQPGGPAYRAASGGAQRGRRGGAEVGSTVRKLARLEGLGAT